MLLKIMHALLHSNLTDVNVEFPCSFASPYTYSMIGRFEDLKTRKVVGDVCCLKSALIAARGNKQSACKSNK
jgi:hypothetical protein